MRIRQIVFAAENLQPTLDRLSALLNGPVVFRDPGVAHFGLENGLLVSGGDFIEVVSPLPDETDTAAGRHLARRGDSFYMLIFQCDDARPHIERLVKKGLQPVWNHDADGLVATHFHPRDFGPAIVSIDSMPPNAGDEAWQSPNAHWFWARWPDIDKPKAEETAAGAVAALELRAPDAAALAQHWAENLQRPLDGHRVLFDGAYIEFVEEAGCVPYIAAVTLRAGQDSPAALLARAEQAGLDVNDEAFTLCGVTWRFERFAG